ncbi:hypothetical protein [Streptomyces aurantiogriseus]|uniref:Uncharacterized protein n=1 Tax=Streptomyces aurantiogriseus TaxID=66870 RepID=A0A918FNM5_9ACTN|nr:hypothetical protein [Streptomyces aurantiogriseus]GGR61011.1 hypothetical protein GCM10010251_92120 [Streptomyces aurantiogriseus]
MSARDEELAAVVKRKGALPMPAGSVPQPSELEALRAQVAALLAERHSTNEALSDAAEALRADRDRIAELEAECSHLRQLPGLPVDKLAKALLLMESGPALPWAQAMSDDDLHDFLGDLVSAAMNRWRHSPEVPDRVTLAEIEKACAQWRTPGEGLRSDEPDPAGIARAIAPTQALQAPVSRPLPDRDVRCGCGHDGAEHHHVGTKCWARLPREVGQPNRVCPCEGFRPVSVVEAAERLARYLAPEGEHYASVHHSYRVPRDLPRLGGA